MATRTWQLGSGTWNASNTANWVEGVVPTANDDVVIPATAGTTPTIAIVGNVPCQSLTTTNAPASTKFDLGNSNSNGIAIGSASGGAYNGGPNVSFINLTGNGIALDFVSTSTNGGAGWPITTGGAIMPHIRCNGVGGSWKLQDPYTGTGDGSALQTIICQQGTFDSGNQPMNVPDMNIGAGLTHTVIFGTSVIALTRNGTNNLYNPLAGGLTLSAASSTINVTGNGGQFQVGQNGLVYGTVNFTGQGAQGFISSNAAATSVTVGTVNRTPTTPTQTDSLLLNAINVVVNNALTLQGGDRSHQMIVNATAGNMTPGYQQTLTNNGTLTIQNCDFQDINCAGTTSWDLHLRADIGDCGGNTGLIATPALPTAWIPSGDTANWLTLSRWTGGRIPLPQDPVTFNANSFSGAGKTVTMNAVRACKSMDWSAITTAQTMNSITSPQFYGDVILSPNLTLSGVGVFAMFNRANASMTFAGTKPFALTVSALGATVTLKDSLIFSALNNSLALNSGNLDASTYAPLTLDVGTVSTNTSATRSLNINGSTLRLNATSASTIISAATANGWSFSGASGTITIVNASVNARTIAFPVGSNPAIGTFNAAPAGSSGQMTMSQSGFIFGTYNDVANAGTGHTTTWTQASTVTAAVWNIAGSPGNLNVHNGGTGWNWVNSSKTSVVNLQGVQLTNAHASGGLGWFAQNSTDSGGNTGILFNAQGVAFQAAAAPIAALRRNATKALTLASSGPLATLRRQARKAPTPAQVAPQATLRRSGTKALHAIVAAVASLVLPPARRAPGSGHATNTTSLTLTTADPTDVQTTAGAGIDVQTSAGEGSDPL